MTWTCSRCGDVHQGAPFSWAWDAPIYWTWIPEEERAARGECHEDLCWLTDDGGDLAHFVRGTIEIPIVDAEDPEEDTFVFGVWASLSQASFERLLEVGDEGARDGESFFGWLSNRVHGYPDTLNLPTDVELREPGIRPLIVPHRGEHPLARDQDEGITLARAHELAAAHLHAAA